MRVRIVSWNVHSCVGSDGVYDPDRTGDVLAALDADVIGLQEVDWRRPRVAGLDQLDLLAAKLGMTGVPGPCLRDHLGEYGNGLLTRHPVSRSTTVPLVHANAEPRGAIDVELALAAGPLRVLVTHLGLRRTSRRRQIHRLREAVDAGVEQPPQPTVLVGDLNEWLPLRLAAPALVSGAFPFVAAARTFPSRWPFLALDYVLARPEPARAHLEVVRTRQARAASDHLPLVCDLEWGAVHET